MIREKKIRRRRRQRPRKAPRITELPDEVILSHILPRLTVKFIFRCKIVCKTWKSMILATQFAQSHLRFSSSNSQQYFIRIDYGGGKWYSVAYDGLTLNRPVALQDDNFFDRKNFWKVLGCCNGLICLILNDTRWSFALWNPATHELRNIPFPENASGALSLYGFCYVPKLDDYVSFVLVGKPLLFSWRTGEWSEIIEANIIPSQIDLGAPMYRVGVCLNDTLYWCAPDRIIGFDLVTRELETIPISDWTQKYEVARLCVIQDCLSLCCSTSVRTDCDVWMKMNKKMGGVAESDYSWEKAFNLPIKAPSIDFSIPGKCIVLHRDNGLESFDLNQKSSSSSSQLRSQGTNFKGYLHEGFTYYFPSLISPFRTNST